MIDGQIQGILKYLNFSRPSKFNHIFTVGWGHRTQFQTLAVGRVGGI